MKCGLDKSHHKPQHLCRGPTFRKSTPGPRKFVLNWPSFSADSFAKTIQRNQLFYCFRKFKKKTELFYNRRKNEEETSTFPTLRSLPSMLPVNQHAGFGDLSFNSYPHSISYFNSAQTPISYPNPIKFHLELHDRTGEEEEDEWAVYTSSRVAPREEIGTGDLQAGPTQISDDSVDDWGLFVTSPLSGPSNNTISPGISSGKLHNGGSPVGPAQKGEDWGLFISNPGESQPKANGRNPASSNINLILTQTNNGGLQAGRAQNEGWGFLSSNTVSTELAPTHQTSDQIDRIDNIQANPCQERTILEEEEEEWGNFVSTPVASPANNNNMNGTRTTIFNEISQCKLGSVNLHVRPIDYEEEWGEFVSSPVASGPKTSVCNSSSASPSLKWQKPKGPIPLSFFGGEEEELEREEIKLETLPNLGPVSVSHSDLTSDASPSISSQVAKEIILNHRGGTENLELRNAPSLKVCFVVFTFMVLFFSRIEIAGHAGAVPKVPLFQLWLSVAILLLL